MTALSVIYTVLLGLACVAFLEAGIYAFFPAPENDAVSNLWFRDPTPEQEAAWKEANKVYQKQVESHGIIHYVISLLGSCVQAAIALLFSRKLGVLADGTLLGAVFTLTVGTAYGVRHGGRIAKFAVATASLVAMIVLGWLQFLPS